MSSMKDLHADVMNLLEAFSLGPVAAIEYPILPGARLNLGSCCTR